MISHHSRKPLLLYRDINEESNCAAEEEVCLLVENHVIILLYAYGGFIPSEFRRVGIYTIDKFMKSIIKKDRKDLLLNALKILDSSIIRVKFKLIFTIKLGTCISGMIV